MGLFSPKWESLEPSKALVWIQKHPNNPDEMIKAAKLAEDPAVKKAALDRISDNKVIEDLALQYCEEAVEKIVNKELLYQMITEKRSLFKETDNHREEQRNAAYRRKGAYLSRADMDKIDKKYRCGFPMQDKMAKLAWARLKTIGDALVFRKIIDQSKTNRNVTYDIADEAASLWIDTCGISPKEIFADIHMDKQIRRKALERIDNQIFLSEYGEKEIQEHPDNEFAVLALRMVTDPEKRKLYCEKYGLHEYEIINTEYEYEKDYEICDVTNLYRCKYCGKEKTDSYRR